MRIVLARVRSPFVACLALLGLPAIVSAWGPHPQITRAPMEALGPDDALIRRLGREADRLPEYCWMADWRRTIRREPDQWFYVDDYLLFPAMPKHVDHLCPDVKATYEPFFRRALQALRTETPINAARWVGSILHFTEDTGSPPHAGEVRGDVHSKMENWVVAKAITIPGYRPRLLGETDDEAVAGFLDRMDGLIAFSRQRCERARPHVLAGDRAATEPIVLESALETARVVADLLHTLGHLADQPRPGTAVLRGTVASTPAVGLEKVPAKVMLLGTTFSTLADAGGRYEFRQLPPGSYTMAVLRPGSSVATADVELAADRETSRDVALSASPGGSSLVRNGEMALRWTSRTRPDAWLAGPKDTWTGEFLPLQPGRDYRLVVEWRDGAEGQVTVRWQAGTAYGTPFVESGPLRPGGEGLSFTGSDRVAFAQVVIRGRGAPGEICTSVSVVPAP